MHSMYESSPYVALTTQYNGGIAREIRTDAEIIIPQVFRGYSHQPVKTTAIWDTGATNTVIAKQFAQQLNLPPTGKIKTTGVHGTMVVETYTIDIVLMGNVNFQNWEVSSGNILGNGIGLLIGMDIISKGDFALTQKDGKTVFTFRIPHGPEPIDFYKEIKDYHHRIREKEANKQLRKRYHQINKKRKR